MFSAWQLKLSGFTGEEWCGRARCSWGRGSCSEQAACFYGSHSFCPAGRKFPPWGPSASSKAPGPPSSSSVLSLWSPTPTSAGRGAGGTWQAHNARLQQPHVQVLPGWRLPAHGAGAGHGGTILTAGAFHGSFLRRGSGCHIRTCPWGQRRGAGDAQRGREMQCPCTSTTALLGRYLSRLSWLCPSWASRWQTPSSRPLPAGCWLFHPQGLLQAGAPSGRRTCGRSPGAAGGCSAAPLLGIGG